MLIKVYGANQLAVEWEGEEETAINDSIRRAVVSVVYINKFVAVLTINRKLQQTLHRESEEMANLKQDLDEYLLLQSDQKKNFNVKMPQIKVPDLGKMFSRNAEQTEVNTWIRETQNTCCPKLSRLQRIVGFVACLGMGALCLTISTFYIPVLILKARKFALLYTLGSLFFILSFCFLLGFGAFIKQMFSKSRLLASGSYACCLFATLYCALMVRSTPLTVLFAVAQVIALTFMILGTVPGGSSGIKFFGQLFKSSVSTNPLPV